MGDANGLVYGWVAQKTFVESRAGREGDEGNPQTNVRFSKFYSE